MLQYKKDVFTREELEQFVASYFETMMNFNYDDPDLCCAQLEPFFADGYVNRIYDWPFLKDYRKWIQFLVFSFPGKKLYHYKIYYQEPDGILMIDRRSGIIVCHVRQEAYDRHSGELKRICYNNIHLKVIRDENSKLKLIREICTHIPTFYQTDSLDYGHTGIPCWLFNMDPNA